MKNLELPSPAAMHPAARAAEITTILAAAITRSLVSGEPKPGAVRLGFLPNQRVHATPSQQEKLQ
ncbi:MAG: hypothetical protein CGU28_05520 [Candidatus Dactylopiibacterium carminicum]|uniref:Uncharacterized protein n=1 Tax=Candidatus Dactylopiibacterium carminicum TaxID=857335 RepID=A0A272ETU2_9RHOO|nr:hypothetical protein [Candidatus Dactylopiibacterium carminicum]KAF7599434.1 hypothetical protein BGI27_07650 [Candidatus Dactylopiibacterium carminicum]PAS93523.1 MAG: hypothetical protein CGU29_07590 [Candidatus Dactylopiibacterium carminicum]PAS97368.1 MAG: hypothetical protein CGU28_05520 [Candidatus Dactylopiibacterium carminicum]PAS99442.1 MAG: hypothetical protein BSR46_07675 [Candidatus Dactylopiibacterium carminicum]